MKMGLKIVISALCTMIYIVSWQLFQKKLKKKYGVEIFNIDLLYRRLIRTMLFVFIIMEIGVVVA